MDTAQYRSRPNRWTNTPTINKYLTYDIMHQFHHNGGFSEWDRIYAFDMVIHHISVIVSQLFVLTYTMGVAAYEILYGKKWEVYKAYMMYSPRHLGME